MNIARSGTYYSIRLPRGPRWKARPTGGEVNQGVALTVLQFLPKFNGPYRAMQNVTGENGLWEQDNHGGRVYAQVGRWLLHLGNLWRRLVLPKRIDAWSLTSLQQRLVRRAGG